MLIGAVFSAIVISLLPCAPAGTLLIILRLLTTSSGYGADETSFSTRLRPAGDFNVNEDG
jgi:hypothetical protein